MKAVWTNGSESEFTADCKRLTQLFADNGVFDAGNARDILALPWGSIESEAVKATQNPEAFTDAAVKVLLGEDNEDLVRDAFLRGVLATVVRAYLGGVGRDMTEILETSDKFLVRKQTRQCPTCGATPSLSAVLQGNEDEGNARRLYCPCCGTVWPFERLRCALCGNANPSQLKYVHSEDDLAHRLHVCSSCGGSLPAVFREALKEPFDQDIETYACIPLATAWMEKNEEQA